MWNWRKKATGEWYAEVYEDENTEMYIAKIYDPTGKRVGFLSEYTSRKDMQFMKESAKYKMQELIKKNEYVKSGPKVEIVTL